MTGVYPHPKGADHHQWKGGLPYCLECGSILTQYRSFSALKRGVRYRCRKCYVLAQRKKAADRNVCKKCGRKVSRAGKHCRKCANKLKKGKHFSPQTEWKPGTMPISHLRSNFGNKFNVAPASDRTYGGVVYHSKMEAHYAQYLDMLKTAGEIAKWERQIPIDITVNGNLLSRYFCDFLVTYKTGKQEYHEVKGCRTELYILKKRLVEAIHGIKIKEIEKFKL